MALSSLGDLVAKFSEMSFPHFKTYFMQMAVIIFRRQFKTFDCNNFSLSSTFSSQNAWPIKRKAVNIL